jgi:hypothetical protein
MTSKEYAERRVNNSPYNEYKNYGQNTQMELTTFDGYDIEQAFEDGMMEAISRIESQGISAIENIKKECNGSN